MKRLAILTSVFLVAIIFISDGCKKEKDKVLNKITISGNTYSEINGDYIPETGRYTAAYLTGCNIIMYHSSLMVTFTDGAQINVHLYNPTTSETIPAGKILSQGGTECAAGFYGWFTPNLAKGEGYGLTGGSITISISGEIYNVDINFLIDETSGGGKLTGNFHGELSPIATR